MIVAGDHVLGAHVYERQQHHPRAFLDEALVALGHAVGQGFRGGHEQQGAEHGQQ
ncbi:hypothetical protein D3C80_2051540 [compost metagenome]